MTIIPDDLVAVAFGRTLDDLSFVFDNRNTQYGGFAVYETWDEALQKAANWSTSALRYYAVPASMIYTVEHVPATFKITPRRPR